MQNRTNDHVEALKFDKRLLDINFKNGTLTKEEYEKFLGQLPDRAENATNMTLEDEEDVGSPQAPTGDATTEAPATTDPNGSAPNNNPGWNDNPFNSTY